MTLAMLKATTGICIILGGWLLVQRLWRIVAGVPADQDALAGRLGCHSCGCKSPCENETTVEQVCGPDDMPAETLDELRSKNL